MATSTDRSFGWHYVAIGLLFAFVASRLEAAELSTFRGGTMGTTYTVKAVVSESGEGEEPLGDRIQARLDEINALMSTYIADSEVSRFNVATTTEWFEVSLETAKVVQRAQELSDLSDGAFDITVGPLVGLWNFGAASRGDAEFQLPSDEQIAETLTSVGYDKIEVRLDPPSIRKSVDTVRIDLSAIAKGYAVDQVAKILTDRACKSFMVEIGGEVKVAGSRPNSEGSSGEGWRIGVESPNPRTRKFELIVTITNQAMATSGDYRNFFRHDDKLYSHTIDPATGRPVEHTLTSCSVLNPDCASADALATAMLVKGPVAGRKWADEHGIPVLMFDRTTNGIERTQNSIFPSITVPKSEPPSFSRLVLISIVVFAIALAGMAVGVIVKNKALTGSCGGLAGMKDETGKTVCQLCSRPAADCDGDPEKNEKHARDGECETAVEA